MRLSGCEALQGASPGQFVMLRGDWDRDPLLPRAFSLLRTIAPGEAQILARTFGRGTSLLERSLPGSRVFVLGPLGNAFPAADPAHVDLLVAGGVGLPPVLLQAEAAAAAGLAAQVELVYGGRTSADIVLRDRLEALGCPVHVATEDGSLGRAGRVTPLLEERLAALPDTGKNVRVMACGPNPMLWAVGAIAHRFGVPCHLSMEEVMACGIGVCLGCAIPARTRPFRYVCKDGPVFEASEVMVGAHEVNK